MRAMHINLGRRVNCIGWRKRVISDSRLIFFFFLVWSRRRPHTKNHILLAEERVLMTSSVLIQTHVGSNCWIPRHSVPPLFSLVGVLWRTKHNTTDAILIQWHAKKWQGILQLSRMSKYLVRNISCLFTLASDAHHYKTRFSQAGTFVIQLQNSRTQQRLN